jgi:hypothetical protein
VFYGIYRHILKTALLNYDLYYKNESKFQRLTPQTWADEPIRRKRYNPKKNEARTRHLSISRYNNGTYNLKFNSYSKSPKGGDTDGKEKS